MTTSESTPAARVAPSSSECGPESHADLATGFAWDDSLRSFIIKRTGPWLVTVCPMIFNDRVVLSWQEELPDFWTAGYCYDKGAAAFLAAAAWDPLRELRPVGFKKIAAESEQRWIDVMAHWREQV